MVAAEQADFTQHARHAAAGDHALDARLGIDPGHAVDLGDGAGQPRLRLGIEGMRLAVHAVRALEAVRGGHDIEFAGDPAATLQQREARSRRHARDVVFAGGEVDIAVHAQPEAFAGFGQIRSHRVGVAVAADGDRQVVVAEAGQRAGSGDDHHAGQRDQGEQGQACGGPAPARRDR